jgi:hypothetical protein
VSWKSSVALPFLFRKRFDSASIKRLYIDKRRHRNVDPDTGSVSYGYSYEVHMMTKSGSPKKLLSGLSEGEAQYWRQKIWRSLRQVRRHRAVDADRPGTGSEK